MKLMASKDGNPRYFSVKLGWKEQFDPKEIEILYARAIPQLIPPETVQGRKNNVMQFNISPYSTLDFYLSCILSREQFADVLLQCIQLFRQMQRIYLNYKNLVLDLDQVYVLLGDRTLHFIFLPLVNSTREASIPDFFRKLIRKASRSTYEQVSFLDGCLAWLDRPAPFTLDEFEAFVKTRAPNYANKSAQQFAQIPAPAQSVISAAGESPVIRPQAVPAPDQIAISGSSQGGTTRLDGPLNDTVILDAPIAESGPRFFLTRVQTGEQVEITRSPFMVGKEMSSVDYCIGGNAAVSRRHAQFNIQDGICTVSDQKSTNRTYVNDRALEPFLAQALADGDRVTLANEAFTFNKEG